jgi:hypothetical protein
MGNNTIDLVNSNSGSYSTIKTDSDDARDVADARCVNGFKGQLLSNEELQVVLDNYGFIAETVAGGDTGVIVTSDGVFVFAQYDFKDTYSDLDIGFLCKTTLDLCGLHIGSPAYFCRPGYFYDPASNDCSPTKTDYYVLANGINGLKTAYVADQGGFVTPSNMVVSSAQSIGIESCMNEGYDKDLLLTAELEAIRERNLLDSAISSNLAGGTNAEDYFVAKDGGGCFRDDQYNPGSYVNYSCGNTMYSIICPKTFAE